MKNMVVADRQTDRQTDREKKLVFIPNIFRQEKEGL